MLYKNQKEHVVHVNLLAAFNVKRYVVQNDIKFWTISCCVVVESHVTF